MRKLFLFPFFLAFLFWCNPADAQLFRTAEMKEFHRAPGDGWTVLAFSPDGKTIAANNAGMMEGIQLWTFGTQTEARSLQRPTQAGSGYDGYLNWNQMYSLVFSPDGRYLAGYSTLASNNYEENRKAPGILKALIWEASSGKLVSTLLLQDQSIAKKQIQIRYFTWTKRGPTWITVGLDNAKEEAKQPVRIFSASFDATSKTLKMRPAVTLPDTTGPDWSVGISPDGTRVATAASKTGVLLWNAADGTRLETLANPDASRFAPHGGYGYPRAALNFSPDNQLLLTFGNEYRSEGARVWDTQNGASWQLEGERIFPAAFAPDTTLIAGMSKNGLTVWNARDGKKLGQVEVALNANGYANYGEANLAFWSNASTLAVADRTHLLTYDVGKILESKGRPSAMPQFGAPEVREYSAPEGGGSYPFTRVFNVNNNYGYTVVRRAEKKPATDGKERSELVWQIRQAKSDKLIVSLPTSFFFGDETRAPLAVAPGGKYLAVADWEAVTGNAKIILWDTSRNKEMTPLRVPKENVQRMQFSPDGKFLATSSSDARVRLWNVQSAQLVRLFPAGKGGVLGESETSGALDFSPDGKTLAIPGQKIGEAVVLWNVQTGARVGALPSSDGGGVLDLSFSPDGNFLSAGGPALRVWDLRRGFTNNQPRRAFVSYGWQNWLVDSTPARSAWQQQKGELHLLIETYGSGSFDWDMSWLNRTPTPALHVLSNPTALPDYVNGERTNWINTGILFAPDESTLVAAGRDQNKNVVRLFDTRTGKLRRTLDAAEPFGFTPDGKRVLTTDDKKGTLSFDLQTGAASAFAPAKIAGRDVVLKPSPAMQGSMGTTATASSPLRLIFSPDRFVRREFGAGTRPLRSWLSAPEWMEASAFDNSTSRVAVASGSAVAIWNLANGAQRGLQTVGDTMYLALAFSPDEKTLAGATAFGMVDFWDAQSGLWQRTSSGHPGVIYCMAFSPDGSTLATGSEDYTVRLWDAKTGALKKILEGHANTVTDIAFSPDGSTLASSSYDGTARLWAAD